DAIGFRVVFTWKAVVIAMAVMGFPLVVRAARAGFEQVPRRYEDVAATLGASPARVFRTITLPLAGRSLLAGALLGFSRALGEFGATLMIAGNIPGETRTIAMGIYAFSEAGHDGDASLLIGTSIAVAFVVLWLSNRLDRGAVA
ncbi:MAG: ABC transporter permease subunit, partial [Acidobacteria bacterium]|nr:ABC transporter permease subunit [Acidobacteriota bacterium]